MYVDTGAVSKRIGGGGAPVRSDPRGGRRDTPNGSKLAGLLLVRQPNRKQRQGLNKTCSGFIVVENATIDASAHGECHWTIWTFQLLHMSQHEHVYVHMYIYIYI